MKEIIKNKIWKLKPIIRDIDNGLFNGLLKRTYLLWLERKEKHKLFFKHRKSAVLSEPIVDMVLMQVSQKENGFNQYQAYDFAVRYLAIENYYDKNSSGYELYRKMHTFGGNYGNNNDAEKYYRRVRKRKRTPVYGVRMEQHSVEQFVKLIQSVEEKGYSADSYIMADRNLLSMNGSHRVALAFYKGLERVNVEIYNRIFYRRYSLDFFWEHGFSRDEITLIERTMDNITEECHNRIGAFYCILFPPAEKYFDEITQDINSVESDNISVTDYKDYIWEVPDFVGFLKGVYHFDSILSTNFERKLEYILRSSEIHNNRVKFRIVTIDIKNPMYRLKKDNGMPESMATVRMKNMIRKRYRVKEKKFTERYTGDYAHDVIIHSSDNSVSNHAFRDLLHMNRNLTEVMNAINSFCYVMAVCTEDKISESFPENYYFDEDFDIFVKKEDLDAVTHATYEACKRIFEGCKCTVAIEESIYGRRVRVVYSGFTVTMFDFMVLLPGVKKEYINRFLTEKKKGNVNRLSEEHELIYRTVKLLSNPSKRYHQDFLIKHKDGVDMKRLLDAFDRKTGKRAEKLWKKILTG